jgi:hypothetical protein
LNTYFFARLMVPLFRCRDEGAFEAPDADLPGDLDNDPATGFPEDRGADLVIGLPEDPEASLDGDFAGDRGDDPAGFPDVRGADRAAGFPGDVIADLVRVFAVTFAGAFGAVPGLSGDFPFFLRTIVLPRTSTRMAFALRATACGSTSVFCSHLTLIIGRFLSWATISSIMVPEHPCLPIQTVGLRSCIG